MTGKQHGDARIQALPASGYAFTVTDQEAVDAWSLDFMHGGCHALAIVLHADYGLPLVVMTDPRVTPSDIETDIIHVCVRLSDGLGLDIKGPRPFADMAADFGVADARIDDVTEAELRALAPIDPDEEVLARQALSECLDCPPPQGRHGPGSPGM